MSRFDGWLTSQDVADYLKVYHKTAQRYLSSGAIESRKIGQTYRTRREWCDAWMEGQAA